jgi:predicted RNase H-like HicB family nuclease
MIYKVLLQWDPDSNVWVTHVPELDDISTFGATQDEALQMTKDLILGYLEASKKVHQEPRATPVHLPRIVELAV